MEIKDNVLEKTPKQIKSAVERAVEMLRENPNLKYYEAINKVKSEINEMD